MFSMVLFILVLIAIQKMKNKDIDLDDPMNICVYPSAIVKKINDFIYGFLTKLQTILFTFYYHDFSGDVSPFHLCASPRRKIASATA